MEHPPRGAASRRLRGRLRENSGGGEGGERREDANEVRRKMERRRKRRGIREKVDKGCMILRRFPLSLHLM